MTRKPDFLPNGAEPYRRTPSFDADSLPDGLKQTHATKPGVWGEIVVEAGKLEYVIEGAPLRRQILDLLHPGIVRPEEKHHVRFIEPGRFHVVFYRAPSNCGA
jgi:tellurite resistance-related uncharacterized protein